MKPAKETREAAFPRMANRSAWHDIRFAELTYSLEYPEPPMGEVVRFVPKSELERARLIREARANYERIFPPADPASKRPEPNE
jgi:hypothetical protein